MVEGDLREKSQPSHVHPEDGHGAFLQEPRGAQHGSVAAQHQDHIGPCRELRFWVRRGFADERGSLRVKHHLFLALSKPGDEVCEDVLDVGKLGLGEDADRLHGSPLPVAVTHRGDE